MFVSLTLAALTASSPCTQHHPQEFAAALSAPNGLVVSQESPADQEGAKQISASPAALVGDKTGNVVRLTTTDKVHLAATYYPPRSSTKRAPAAILVHDTADQRSALAPMALYLQKKGFAALTVDLRGHGESATEKLTWKKLDEKARTTQWAFASRDLAAAAKFIRSQKGVHTANLTVIGMGAGSTLAVRHAVDDENVRATILLNPPKESFGFKMLSGVTDLGGLPTLIMSPSERRSAHETLQETCHEDNDGLEYIEVKALKSKAKDMLGDKRLNSSVYAWLRANVMQ